jgi:hypothetical protein
VDFRSRCTIPDESSCAQNRIDVVARGIGQPGGIRGAALPFRRGS